MSNIATLGQAQEVIDSYIGVPPKDGNYKLVNMTKLMNYLGNPQDSYPCLHVAGTSGKTSTAYYLASLLTSSGYKVGLTISPHINKVSERAQINLEPLPDIKYCNELNKFIKLIDKSGIKPSRFEFLTAFAFWLFKRQKVDFAVVEVGLGGMLDATNVINRDDKICLITDIGIDHTKLLGKTIGSIANQKAGIIQNRNLVYMYRQSPNVMRQIRHRCVTKNATLNIIRSDYIDNKNYINLPEFQKRNFNLAYQTVKNIIKESSLKVAKTVIIPGRMEKIGKIVIDGSHNVQKISSLVNSFKKTYPKSRIIICVAFGNSEKLHIQTKFNVLRQISDAIIVTKFTKAQDEARISINPSKLAIYAKMAGFKKIIIESDYEAAYKTLQKLLDEHDLGLVTGSFYLAAAVRKLIR